MNVDQAAVRRINTSRHLEIAWQLLPATQLPVSVPKSRPVMRPMTEESWSDAGVEWLDTPATHCSPLDDY